MVHAPSKPTQDPIVLGGCVYYSQNREDLILMSFFPDVKEGFYVDVGAFHPDYDSVTKLFYKKGWRGVNIEPQPARHKLFEKKRKRDMNINVGISLKPSTLTLRMYKSQGLATFSEEIKQDYEKAPDIDTTEYTEATLPVRPLRSVLADCKVEHIHFLKVDVEGLEYEVLASNDWKRFRPEVICIEANHVTQDWHGILKKEGYELVFDDGLNEYYADKNTDRKQKFDFVKYVVNDRGGGLRAEWFDMMLRWRDYALEQERLARENENHKHELEQELKQMEQRLNRFRHAVARVGRLIKRTAADEPKIGSK